MTALYREFPLRTPAAWAALVAFVKEFFADKSTRPGLLARSRDLAGQGEDVDQHKARQALHGARLVTAGVGDAVHGLVAVEAQLMRPFLNRRGNEVAFGQRVDAFFQPPRLHFGAQRLEADLQRPAEHRAGRRRQSGGERVIAFLEGFGYSVRQKRRDVDPQRFGEHPLNDDAPGIARRAEIAGVLRRVSRAAEGRHQAAVARRTKQQRRPAFAILGMPRGMGADKTVVSGSAVRAIVRKDRHD